MFAFISNSALIPVAGHKSPNQTIRNMKKNRSNPLSLLPTAAAVAFLGCATLPAATIVWTNGPTDMNWSSADNWIGGVAPGATDDVRFYDDGTAGSPGAVNNIVSADTSISSLQYAPSNYLYHTTEIASGRTLTVTNGLTAGGTLTADGSLQVFSSITGAGGALSVSGNTSARLWVGQGSTVNFTTPLATLDMSGLDTFQSTAGLVSVGVKLGTVAGNPLHLNWPQGTLILAKTNLIVAAGSPGTLGNAAVMVGYSPSNPGIGIVQLGQTNAILANGVSVGDRRSMGTINFYSGVSANNPSLFLRNATGARLANLWIGDEFAEGGTATTSTGTVDLTGGTLDAQVDNLIVARGMNVNNRATVATGTLTFEAGLLDVNTLRIGTQTGYTVTTQGGIPKGTVTVNSGANGAAVLLVNNTFTMAEVKVPHANANNVTANLNINGGTVIAPSITTTATTNGATIYRGASTITISSGTLTVTNGIIGAPGYPITTLTLGDSVLEIPVPASGPAVVVSTLQTTSSTNNTVNLSSLPLVASYPAQFPVIRYAGFGGAFDLQVGTLPAGSPVYQGYLVDNPANGTIDLVLTAGPVGVHALTWTGATDGNWDTTTTNWVDQTFTPAAFTQGDFVVFDDTASINNVTLAAPMAATTLTVNNPTKDYAFGGSGGLNGQAGTYGLTGLDKEGDATLVISNSSVNTFTGGILIGGGTLRIAGSSDRLPVTSTVTLADAASAVLDLNDLNQTLGALNGGGASGGNVLLASGTLTLTNGSGGFGGVISGTGKVVKRGTGTQILSGANTYSGGTVASNGTLVVANPSGSGTGSGNVIIAPNATLSHRRRRRQRQCRHRVYHQRRHAGVQPLRHQHVYEPDRGERRRHQERHGHGHSPQRESLHGHQHHQLWRPAHRQCQRPWQRHHRSRRGLGRAAGTDFRPHGDQPAPTDLPVGRQSPGSSALHLQRVRDEYDYRRHPNRRKPARRRTLFLRRRRRQIDRRQPLHQQRRGHGGAHHPAGRRGYRRLAGHYHQRQYVSDRRAQSGQWNLGSFGHEHLHRRYHRCGRDAAGERATYGHIRRRGQQHRDAGRQRADCGAGEHQSQRHLGAERPVDRQQHPDPGSCQHRRHGAGEVGALGQCARTDHRELRWHAHADAH